MEKSLWSVVEFLPKWRPNIPMNCVNNRAKGVRWDHPLEGRLTLSLAKQLGSKIIILMGCCAFLSQISILPLKFLVTTLLGWTGSLYILERSVSFFLFFKPLSFLWMLGKSKCAFLWSVWHPYSLLKGTHPIWWTCGGYENQYTAHDFPICFTLFSNLGSCWDVQCEFSDFVLFLVNSDKIVLKLPFKFIILIIFLMKLRTPRKDLIFPSIIWQQQRDSPKFCYNRNKIVQCLM